MKPPALSDRSHGDTVGPDFVRAQAAQLTQMAERFTEVLEGGLAGVDALISSCRGLGLQEETLREAAVRALEAR